MSILDRLRRWSLRKLVLVCIGWLAASLVLPLLTLAGATIFYMLRGAGSGSGGIGAVSAGCVEPAVIFFLPVIVLVTLWIVARRTAVVPTPSAPPGTGEAGNEEHH